jgi:ribosomal protein S8
MADFRTYVDIEPKEFVDNCSSQEIEELVDILIEEGYLDGVPVTSERHHNLLDEEWAKTISKLNRSRLLLSNEEEILIKNIANRF